MLRTWGPGTTLIVCAGVMAAAFGAVPLWVGFAAAGAAAGVWFTFRKPLLGHVTAPATVSPEEIKKYRRENPGATIADAIEALR